MRPACSDVPAPEEAFALGADLNRCEAAMCCLLDQLPLEPVWAERLRLRYRNARLRYHGAAHVGLLWLRHVAHGGAADDLGIALAIMFHDAVYEPEQADNEVRSADLLLQAAPRCDEAGWAAQAIRATADHVGYSGGDRRVVRLLDLDLTPLAERPEIFDRNLADLQAEVAASRRADWTRRQRVLLGRFLERAPLFRSELGEVYEGSARHNLERFCCRGASA